jgi:hypothetical protein
MHLNLAGRMVLPMSQERSNMSYRILEVILMIVLNYDCIRGKVGK